jgi:hypothetical protein
MAAVLPNRENYSPRPDSLADEPVNGEPVSEEDSLLTGKRTGKFVKIGPFGKEPPVRT